MAVSIPFSSERYMQLIAEGFSDKECAMRMHVKESILVSEYLPIILRKAEVATREEFVQHVQSGQEARKGVPPKELNNALKGPKMLQARAFYRALERHFFADDCVGCKSYFKYGVMLVKGQCHRHLEMFLPNKYLDVLELVSQLETADMIHIQQTDELYRVTFVHLQSKEAENYGDNNL
jgi:hypothetical protein